MNTIKIDRRQTQMIAHRGVCGIEPENTLSSFVAACNRSYLGVETDVHTTLDGEFVLIHDDATGRVAGDDVEVSKTTYDLLKHLILNNTVGTAGCGAKDRYDLRIPTLAEYIGVCKKYEKKCIVEIKNQFDPKDLIRMAELIQAMKYLDQTVFISFDLAAMIQLRRLLPGQELQYLTCVFNSEVLTQLNQYSLDVDLEYTAVTPETVETLHRNGHKINCWTCDDKEAAEKLADWGVDFITTNILE